MRVLYTLTTGRADATKASLGIHLAVNGSVEIGDQPVLLLAGDAAELVAPGGLDGVEGVGVPPLAELFEKARSHEVPVFV